jgi:hypothetical protein
MHYLNSVSVVPSPLVPDDQFTDRIGNPRGQPHA